MRAPGAARAGATCALALAVALALAGCAGDGPDPAVPGEDDRAQACAAGDELASALADLRAVLRTQATLDEVRAAGADVGEAVDAVRAEAAAVAESRTDDLVRAWDALTAAVDDVDGDTVAAEAVGTLREAGTGVRDALDALVAELDCASTVPGS